MAASADTEPMLTDEQLAEVMRELPNFTEWKKLGENIGLSAGQLGVIKANCKNEDIDEYVRHVLLQWLKRNHNEAKYGKPTWRNLANGIYHFDTALADRIRAKHCPSASGEASVQKAKEQKIPQAQSTLRLTELHLSKIARKLKDWESKTSEFGVSDTEVEAIKSNNSSLEVQKKKMLLKWKQKEGNAATKEKIVEIFQDLDDTEMVDYINEYIK